MSIATEISRLQTAKTNIKSAIEAKGVTVGTGTIDTYPAKIAGITSGGGIGSEIYALRMGTKTTITNDDMVWLSGLINKLNGLRAMFYYTPTITSVTLTTPFELGEGAFYGTFYSCTEITTVNLSGLTSVTSESAWSAFNLCNKITYVDLSNLSSGVAVGTNKTRDMFTSSLLTTVYAHPHVFSSSSTINAPFYRTVKITTVTLSAIATESLYFNWQPLLSSVTILHILQNLDTVVTGETCVFANITIAAGDSNRTAIGNMVSSLTNWTISGLTLQ